MRNLNDLICYVLLRDGVCTQSSVHCCGAGSDAARIRSRPDPEPSFFAGTEADLSNLVDLRYHITKTLSLGNTVSGHMCCKLYFYLSSIQEQCKLNVFLHTVSTYSRCTKMLTCRYPYTLYSTSKFKFCSHNPLHCYRAQWCWRIKGYQQWCMYIVQCTQLGTDNNIFKSKIRIVSRREESATVHSYGYGTGYAISGPQLISTKFFVHIWSLTNWVFL